MDTLGYLSSWRNLWTYLCQVLESYQDPQGLHFSSCHLSLFDDRNDSSLDSGCGHGSKLEVTGQKQWPSSVILFPLMEPHQHSYNISNMVIFSYTLELVSPSWLHHILGLILNPWDDTGQRWPCVSHMFQAQWGCRFQKLFSDRFPKAWLLTPQQLWG